MTLRLLKIIFLFSLFKLGYGQQYFFKNIAIEDGLVQSQVTEIIQDHRGYLWFGTYGGITRYDGKFLKNYTIHDGLKDIFIHSFLESSKKDFWVGTNKGIHRYAKDRFNYVESVGERVVNDIKEDVEGNIWVGTPKGLFVLSNKMDSSWEISISKNIQLDIYALEFVSKNELLIGTKKRGLWKHDIKSGSTDSFLSIKPNMTIHDLHKLDANNLYVATSSGMYVVGNDGEIIDSFYQNVQVIHMEFDADAICWLATKGKGAVQLNLKNGNTIEFNRESGLGSDEVYSIYQDREKNTWIGTYGDGVSVFNGFKFITYTKLDGLKSDGIASIIELDQNNIILGTTEAGLQYLKKEDQYVVSENPLIKAIVGKKIWSSFKDSKGNFWFGTTDGVYIYDGKRTENYGVDNGFYNDVIYTIEEDSKRNIWLGTQVGAVRYSNGSFDTYLKEDGLPDNWIWDIYNDDSGYVWFSTGQGVSRYDGKSFKTFSSPQISSLKSDILATIQDRWGNMWFASYGGGLINYNSQDSTYKVFNTADGLKDASLLLMTIDNNNNLWVGHSKGLDRLDLKRYYNEKKPTFNHYGKNQGFVGIESIQNAVYKDRKGKLWFGTIKGVTKYDPDYDSYNPIPPQTFIKNITVNKASIDIDSSVHFEYNQNRFTFEWIGISLTAPEKVKYQFKLEGLEDEWSPITEKTDFTYSNLPHGNYVFKVKARNGNDVWNEHPSVYAFTIRTPFYLALWFWLLCLLSLFAIIYAYVKYRTIQIEKEKKILEAKVEERTQELVKEKEKVELINKEVLEQKEIIEEKNKDITDSINYAKQIQDAILPVQEVIYKSFKDAAILFLPKDIVSGDFYWFARKDDKAIIAAVDCTGHGVPGAFMSMIGNDSLNHIVNHNDITQPAEILHHLHLAIQRALKQNKEDSSSRDGMDIALCAFDIKTNVLEYAGAFRPLYLLKKDTKELEEVKGDRCSIGGFQVEEGDRTFENHRIELQKGDSFYIFSDGYADQFGGERGKKFLAKRFKELIINNSAKKMEEQVEIFKNNFITWRANYEQIDDVLIIGVKVS